MSILKRSDNLSKVTLWLFLGLLLVRIPIIKSIEYFIHPLPGWMIQIFEVAMYLLIGILIFREKDNLVDYFIDKLSVVIFILSSTILGFFVLFYEAPMYWIALIFWGIAVSLIILLRKRRLNFEKIKADTYAWLFTGFTIGIFLSFFLAIPRYLALEEQFQKSSHTIVYLFVLFLFSLVNQFVHASVIEEFMFRGFLWGCLRKFGMADKWILFVQAGLFWVAHINYIDRGYSFWVVVPLSGLVFGLLAWQSKSIATSMIAHSVVNAMTYVIFDVLAYLN